MKKDGGKMKRILFVLGLIITVSITMIATANGEGFTVFYHEGMNEPAEEQTTYVEYGMQTPTLSFSDLGYEETECHG